MLVAAGCRDRSALDPAREHAYRVSNRGVALLEQFKYPEAAAAFTDAVRLAPSLGLAHLNLGLALFYSGDLAGAAREETEAARLLPSLPQPSYILGLVARADNRDDDAVAFFERVRQIDPHDAGTNTNLGQVYLQQRKFDAAAAVLRGVVADEPYNVTAAYNLGLALTRLGQTSDGQRLLERSQELRNTGYAVTFGAGYLEQGRYAEAVASTGAEPDLVDARTPAVTFRETSIGVAIGGGAMSSPIGARFSPDALAAAGRALVASALGGGVALVDFDGDGDLDLVAVDASGQHVLRNDNGAFTDVTAGSGIESVPAKSVPVGVVAGDVDNDGIPDLFVLRDGVSSLYRGDGKGHFTDVTARAKLPAYPYLPSTAALVDVDHDGDLDLVIGGIADVEATVAAAAGKPLMFPRDFAPAPLQLLRNNGDGTFTDITHAAGLDVRGHAVAIAPTDFDNRRDIDLLVANADAPPRLFKNMRDGTFRDVAGEVGLGDVVKGGGEVTAVAVADVNKDGFPDMFFARTVRGVFAMSDGRGRFSLSPAPTSAGAAAQFVDYDNDGLLDLLTLSVAGPRLLRNVGREWRDVTATAFPATAAQTPASAASRPRSVLPRLFAAADLNGDGATDIVAGSSIWRNSATSGHRALRVALKGTVSNRAGVGAKVELRAGSLSARLDTSSATPPIAPADLVFGLGGRQAADVVRVLWPSGIVQAETDTLDGRRVVDELNRKASSCPFLFTWNGRRFEFVTDFLGAGEMGYWEGPGERNRPNPIEYVRIRGDQLRPRNGRYEIRVTNELEETLYLDRLQLLAVAHPRGVEIFPNEGMTDPPKAFRLHTVVDVRPPIRAVDDHGHDVTDRIARLDRRYPDDFTLSRFRGYAEPHTLTIDLTDPTHRTRATYLLLTGWTDYAFSSDNLAAHQAGLSLAAPSLQVKSTAGAWRTIVADIGIPVGRPQTIAIDLTGLLRPGEHEVRIATNMRIYWDQALVARPAPDAAVRIARLDARSAVLRERGYSAELRPGGAEPVVYDYDRVANAPLWKVMPGRYTRIGDVRELLARADDRFVVARPGDEIAVAFDEAAAGSVPDGWTRTFLLLADGFSKEMDVNSASPDFVAPLPFHGMTHYPYGAAERRPAGAEYDAYRDRYNTRAVFRPLDTVIGSK